MIGRERISREFQYKLLRLCLTEDEVLELLDYLVADKGVRVREVIGSIRCATSATSSHARRLIYAEFYGPRPTSQPETLENRKSSEQEPAAVRFEEVQREEVSPSFRPLFLSPPVTV